MTILMGTDEAGYGPNLGPLVVSATVWQVPDELSHEDLYHTLRAVVRASPDSDAHVAIADSKALYKPGGGLGHLERGVLAGLEAWSGKVRTWRTVWRTLAARDADCLQELPWYDGHDAAVPVALAPQALDAAARRLGEGLRAARVSLVRMCSSVAFPARFNELLDQHDSKGTALSHETLELVRQLLEECDDQRIVIQCDKHGGRNQYGRFLQTLFPEYLVEVIREGRAASVYRWGPRQRRVEIRFVTQGERFLPAALASMTSKYLRELAMQPFNAFWQRLLPELKPTAGYPVDAQRFKREIAAVQRELRIEDRLLWRVK